MRRSLTLSLFVLAAMLSLGVSTAAAGPPGRPGPPGRRSPRR